MHDILFCYARGSIGSERQRLNISVLGLWLKCRRSKEREKLLAALLCNWKELCVCEQSRKGDRRRSSNKRDPSLVFALLIFLERAQISASQYHKETRGNYKGENKLWVVCAACENIPATRDLIKPALSHNQMQLLCNAICFFEFLRHISPGPRRENIIY